MPGRDTVDMRIRKMLNGEMGATYHPLSEIGHVRHASPDSPVCHLELVAELERSLS